METARSSETSVSYHIITRSEDGGSKVLRNVGILPHHYTLKMEAARSFETSVSYHNTTRSHKSENLELDTCLCQPQVSYQDQFTSTVQNGHNKLQPHEAILCCHCQEVLTCSLFRIRFNMSCLPSISISFNWYLSSRFPDQNFVTYAFFIPHRVRMKSLIIYYSFILTLCVCLFSFCTHRQVSLHKVKSSRWAPIRVDCSGHYRKRRAIFLQNRVTGCVTPLQCLEIILTAWNSVLLEKPIVSQLIRFTALYGAWSFIAVFLRALH